MTPCRQPFADYCKIDAVNWSTLREATKSALHYQHGLHVQRPETDAMRLGRATHTAVFEPECLEDEYAVWDGGMRRGKDWEAFKDAHKKRTILKEDEYERALAIRDAVRSSPQSAPLLHSGIPECTIEWTDKATGLPCKARLDWLSEKALVDLKTTRDIEARAFGRHVGTMLYHCQFAFASMGLRANGLKRKVKIIAVEQDPPHDVAVYELSEDVLWAGEVKVRQALNTVASCRRTKRWTGRYPDECSLVLPSWEFPSEDEQDALIKAVSE